MKKLFWLTAGITVGLVAAKQIEKNPKAKAAYDQATSQLMGLVAAFTEGYSEELKEAKPKTATKASAPKSAK
jgi:hypothetical protein